MNNLFDMSMGQLTEFAVGDDLLAESLNQPIAAINRAMQVRVRSPHQVEYPPVTTQQWRTVVIVGIIEGTSLICRFIQYALTSSESEGPAGIPIIGRYEWDGPNFEAYPALGVELEEYESAVWDSDIDAETTFFNAHRIRDVWILDAPVTSVSLEFVVLDWIGMVPPPLFMKVLKVNPVKIASDASMSIGDDVITALPWPGYDAGIYSPLLKARFTPPESAPVLGMVNVGGFLFVSLDLKWDLQSLDGSVEVSQCPV